jgi:tetratricopeptide (TPR) repeat protein
VVSAATLAALETRGDLHGVAAGLLLAGEIDRADGYLSRSPPSVAVDADRAAVLIERGKVLEALAALDGVLARAPALPQALFNRALVLRQMGLRLAAAEAFDKVAALEEEGWRDEARKVADAQRSREQWRQAAWNGAVAAGHAMAVEGRLPDAMVVDASPDCIRHFFYHAVRMAPTPERVGSLAPIACRLDARAGGHTLSDLVVRAAANRNPARGAWAATYGRLLDRSDALSDEDKERYIAALRAAGEDDMLFGALVLSDRASAHADELERIATAAHDPWLSTVALWHRADAQLSRGDRQGAVSTLRQAITRYAGEPVAWPLAKLASMLTWLLVNDGRTAEGRSVALQGLRLGRRSAPEMMNNFLFRLADIGRIEGDASSAAAFGREAELVDPNDCAVVSATHTVLAEVRARALDVQGLDAELVGAAKCHPPMTPQLADLIVSSVRMGGHPPGEGSVLADLAAARSHLPPASRMFADVVEARRLYVDDPAAGEARAARVLLEAHPAAVHDVGALQAEVYARLTLAIGAATAGNGDEALAQIAAGALRSDASSAVSGCALGLAVDGDRELAVTRGASGPVSLHLTTRASAALTPDATVAREAAARFAGCPTVRVYALPPVRGMAGALPADIAWAYVSAPAVLSPAGAAPRRVVVSEPVPPADLALPGLDGWGPPPEGVAWLHGPEATPSAVLGAFSTATEISVQAHGMVDSTESATAFIALSPEGGGRYALTADDLRADSFRAHPVVVLAACHAARSAGHEVDSWSLPAAFVRAGARAVLASPREIRAAQAGPFFDGVMSRIRAGAAPSVALRDERASWLARDPNSPVGDVVDFE